ncbi:MAG: permease [Pseudomonadota bacterium]
MTDTSSIGAMAVRPKRLIPDLPLVVWMVLLTLALGLGGGLGANDVVAGFNTGFGRALGEFALILLPSFTLAAALTKRNVGSVAAGRTAAIVSPVAGAGMICPDTAYAALAPAAGRKKLDVAFGSYAGFKLLYPAGPLIVALGLGVPGAVGSEPILLFVYGLLLALPVWIMGVIWGRVTFRLPDAEPGERALPSDQNLLITFAPFVLMSVLLLAGGVIDSTGSGLVDFLLLPKGALMCAAVLALLQMPPGIRRDCLDSAVRRTASLLLVIGAASAFGAILTGMVPLDRLVPTGSGMLTLVALFTLSVLFKLAQGSSMATFAAVAPVAGPIVVASGMSSTAAVFAICLGSFIAILPNDSFYWLVRRDALATEDNEWRAIFILTGGAVLQAVVGMAVLLLAVALWA